MAKTRKQKREMSDDAEANKRRVMSMLADNRAARDNERMTTGRTFAGGEKKVTAKDVQKAVGKKKKDSALRKFILRATGAKKVTEGMKKR